MTRSDADRAPNDAGLDILCLVSLPPPVTGRTVATRRFLTRLRRRARLSVHDLSPSDAGRLGKAGRSLLWMFRLAAGAARRRDFVYIVANHGAGLWFDIAFAAFARLWGVPVIVHHHVFSYFTRRRRRVALLFRLTGHGSFHLLLCEAMRESAARHYRTSAQLRVMPNFGSEASDATSAGPDREATGPLRLLFLSNLTREKGVYTVLELACELCKNQDVFVVLAGPAADSEIERDIERCREACSGRLVWHGPVDSQARAKLLARSDLFLFPTRYANEAQPLVIIEALEAGVPALANGRGCIPGMLAHGMDAFLVEDSGFIQAATGLVERMRTDPDFRRELPERAKCCAAAFLAESEQSLECMVEALPPRRGRLRRSAIFEENTSTKDDES